MDNANDPVTLDAVGHLHQNLPEKSVRTCVSLFVLSVAQEGTVRAGDFPIPIGGKVHRPSLLFLLSRSESRGCRSSVFIKYVKMGKTSVR